MLISVKKGWEKSVTPVFQNPPNTLSGGVWTPSIPSQEVLAGSMHLLKRYLEE